MANKPGSSSYGKGDTGGACGDYEHGFGPKMHEVHRNALSKASPARLAQHDKSMKRLSAKVRRRKGRTRMATDDVGWRAGLASGRNSGISNKR